MESEDYAFYQGLVYLVDNNVEHLGYDLTFSTEVRSFSELFPITYRLHVCSILLQQHRSVENDKFINVIGFYS